MPTLKGSKTEQSLKDAFAGESQANRRYLYFANKADVEGQNDVVALFRSTAEGETGRLQCLDAVICLGTRKLHTVHVGVARSVQATVGATIDGIAARTQDKGVRAAAALNVVVARAGIHEIHQR